VWHVSFTCVWHVSFTCVWHVSFTCVWHVSFTCVWHVSFTCVCHASFTCVWYASFMCAWHVLFPCVRPAAFQCVTWTIHTRRSCSQSRRAMTHSYAWHDSFMCVTWLIHTRDRTHSYRMSHELYVWVTNSLMNYMYESRTLSIFIHGIGLIHIFDMPHSLCDMALSHVWHDSFIWVTMIQLFIRVTGLIHMCDMTHSDLKE